MAVLFLDPLVLALLLALVVYVWLVWRGRVRGWFGRPQAWTLLAWPVPLLAIAVPPLAGGLLWLASALGLEVGDGDVADAALYAAVYVVPAIVLVVWPPGWLLPAWARRRLTKLPVDPGADVAAGTFPAVQSVRGHGSRARWVWRVDGVAGHVWVDGQRLRFRAASRLGSAALSLIDIDDESLAELRFSEGGELRLEAPRGGWWRRGHLDVELAEIDRVRFRGVVPWRRDGSVTFEVTGRRPSQLWVADVRHVRALLARGGRWPTTGSDGRGDRPS
jgi:hypothetical protein